MINQKVFSYVARSDIDFLEKTKRDYDVSKSSIIRLAIRKLEELDKKQLDLLLRGY